MYKFESLSVMADQQGSCGEAFRRAADALRTGLVKSTASYWTPNLHENLLTPENRSEILYLMRRLRKFRPPGDFAGMRIN